MICAAVVAQWIAIRVLYLSDTEGRRGFCLTTQLGNIFIIILTITFRQVKMILAVRLSLMFPPIVIRELI